MKINIITLFPKVFEEFKNLLPFNRALQKNLIELNIINLRDFAVDERGSVDDTPYGGGKGMILRIEPLVDSLKSIQNPGRVIVLNPKGKRYHQKIAEELSHENSITIYCGRYEGFDQRFIENYATDEISIGDFVGAGGEAPAIAILESIVRLIPGILEEEATKNESFTENNLEYPQYTRPENYEGLKVPDVLLSGNHASIEKWKKENSQKIN